jgi:hypothetical protein
MMRRCMPLRQFGGGFGMAGAGLDDGATKLPKQKEAKLGGRVKTGRITMVRYREKRQVDGETLLLRGVVVKKSASKLVENMKQMENPMVWTWYPWRRNPEPPLPSFPCPNALKNFNGAFLPELSPKQLEVRQKALDLAPRTEYSAPDPAARFSGKHPFLNKILRETTGQRKGFPFFFKKYPSRQFASETRFNIPEEMLEGMPTEIQRGLSSHNMSENERLRRELNVYRQRYQTHDLETTNACMRTVTLALEVRELRNHCLSNPHNNLAKFKLAHSESSLARHLRKLRKRNFRKYWEIVRDHDLMDVLQPHNNVTYRQGAYWKWDWDHGDAISTNIATFMDPRGVSGCVETGRSRAEVARDLGLSYTRPLLPGEKKQLTSNALHFERLQKFKNELPDAFIERERARFVSHFTGIFSRVTTKSGVPDFPSTHRRLLHTKILRWKSSRHGPR